MAHAIVGEWELFKGEGGGAPLERIEFLEEDGRLRVRYADADTPQPWARVDETGDALRFEILSAGSSRGNAHYSYELTLTGPAGVAGTRRRGLLAKVPVTGRRIAAAPAAGPDAAVALQGGPVPASLAEAKARAAEAAERAAQAAAEAAAAQAEVEAAAALDAARRAAARAAAARANLAAAATAGPVPPAAPPIERPAAPAGPVSGRRAVPPDMLALIPAPTRPPALAPTAPGETGARVHRLRVTHRIDFGGSAVSAVEVFPGVFLWGESYATSADRLREVGWVATPVDSEETLDVDERRIADAASLRDALAG